MFQRLADRARLRNVKSKHEDDNGDHPLVI